MIGLLGANGKIGREVYKALKTLDNCLDIKCGYHSKPRGIGENWEYVDISSEISLVDFIRNCSLIVNASGPSEELSELVFLQACNMQVPLVDIGDSKCFKNKMADNKTTVLYGCGAVPGVIGLIPRYLTQGFDLVYNLNVDYMINEIMTMTAALDMVSDIQVTKEPLKTNYGSVPESLPLFGEDVFRYQFTDEESKGVDLAVKTLRSRWSMIRENDQFEKTLQKSYQNKEQLARAMRRLSQINLQGNKSCIRFGVEISGMNENKEKTVTCLMQCDNPSALSGKAVASAAYTLLKSNNHPSNWRMSLYPEWLEIWDKLNQLCAFDLYEIYPYSLDLTKEEEGEL